MGKRLFLLVSIIVIVLAAIILIEPLQDETTFAFVRDGNVIGNFSVKNVDIPLDEKEACTVVKQAFVTFLKPELGNTFECDVIRSSRPAGSNTTYWSWSTTYCSATPLGIGIEEREPYLLMPAVYIFTPAKTTCTSQ